MPRGLTWAALLLILLAETALFFWKANRDVVRYYPRRFDQATYLSLTYETYERCRNGGFARGVVELAKRGLPNGILLPIEAVTLFQFTGASRLSALSLNLLHFVILAVALFLACRRLTGRSAAGFLGVGLLLMARTPYFWPGGLMDFRFDFAASCLFGTCVCLAILSDGFARPGISLLAGLAMGVCAVTRFLTLGYFGVLGLAALLLLLNAARVRADRAAATGRLRGLAIAASALGVIGCPVVWAHRGAIRAYYLGEHLGDVGRARVAAEFHRGTAAFLAYYPFTVLVRHAGPLVIAFSLGAGALAWRGRLRAGGRAGPANERLKAAALVVAASSLVPCALLTADPQRQPDVASILLVPVLLAFFLWMITGFRRAGAPSPYESVGAAAAIAAGLVFQVVGVSLSRVPPRERRDLAEVARLHDAAFSALRRSSSAFPIVSADRFRDSFDANVLRAYAYERHGVLLRARQGLGSSVLERPDDEVVGILAGSDLVLLTRVPAPGTLVFPFTRQMERIRSRLEDVCASRFVSEGRFRFFGGEVELFSGSSLAQPEHAQEEAGENHLNAEQNRQGGWNHEAQRPDGIERPERRPVP